MFNLLRLVLVPLEYFIVAFAIVNVLTGDYIWLIGIAIYSAWIIYNGGVGQALISFCITTPIAIAYLWGGWIWSVITFVAITVIYEIVARNSKREDDEY